MTMQFMILSVVLACSVLAVSGTTSAELPSSGCVEGAICYDAEACLEGGSSMGSVSSVRIECPV